MEKRELTLIGLCLTVLILIGAYVALNSETRVLRRKIAAGDVDFVNKFVDTNLSKPDEQENVLLALHMGFDTHMDGVVNHFEELVINDKLSEELKVKVLSEFANRSKAFANSSALFDALANNDEHRNDYGAMLAVLLKSSLDARRAMITSRLDSIDTESLSELGHNRLQQVLNLASAIVPESKDEIDNMRRLDDERYSSGTQAAELPGKINDNEEEINSSLSQLSKKPFQLSGYIVGQHSYGIYEIAPSSGGNHALLFATTTQFQTKGYFSLLVSGDTGEIPETLKEEYGGFIQTWKVYSECDDNCLRQRDELAKKVDELRQQNDRLREQYTSMSRSAADATPNLNRAICAFKHRSSASTEIQASSGSPLESTPKTSSPSTGASAPTPSPGPVRENPKDGLKYVWIPPGTFMMGCSPGDNECYDNEKPSHRVTITKGFWLGQTLVTVGAYKRFVGATGRRMPSEPKFSGLAQNPMWGDDAMPMVNVTWDEGQSFCGWAGGRLPTEAEWEYAARGGSTEARYGPLDEVAWYADNSGQQRMDSTGISMKGEKVFEQRLRENDNGMHEVGLKQANSFGLFDMLGNVWELVSDWYDENYYQHSPAQDPTGPSSGEERVTRGGSHLDFPSGNRVSTRVKIDATNATSGIGFRCARGAN